MDRQRVKPCMRIIKPELIDENVFEVVGGTSKVLKPSLLSSPRRFEHESRIKTFFSRSGASAQSRRKVNETMIFLKKEIKPLVPVTHCLKEKRSSSSDRKNASWNNKKRGTVRLSANASAHSQFLSPVACKATNRSTQDDLNDLRSTY